MNGNNMLTLPSVGQVDVFIVLINTLCLYCVVFVFNRRGKKRQSKALTGLQMYSNEILH